MSLRRAASRQRTGSAAEQCFLFQDCLPDRLRTLGLRDVDRVVTHSNRTVMLSLHRRVLRIHRGYGFAPDGVLQAIVRFLSPRIPRALRRAAEREFLQFPVAPHGEGTDRVSRKERPRPGDAAILERLEALHWELNLRHFGGALSSIPIRLSGRMKTRLGELSVDAKDGRAHEIGISRRHVARHPWAEVEHTMLHEMVHQWQAETGRPVDHRTYFRTKAREVGVLPAARRKFGTTLASKA